MCSKKQRPKDWVVEVVGGQEAVEDFCQLISEDLASHQPEVSFHYDDAGNGELVANIQMYWDSIGMENILNDMDPDGVKITQYKHSQEGQDVN